jgi:quinol monooxygenase YgiN|tara:strand:- start:237 stop:521 length:285 start_codon:yes stop_codon:yes gene_type:complete
MIAVIAKLNVKAGCETEFEAAMLNLVSQVNENEPGNHLYKLCKEADGNYVVMELYEDKAAIAAHGASAHFKAAGAKFGDLLAGAPEITSMEVIG